MLLQNTQIWLQQFSLTVILKLYSKAMISAKYPLHQG